ncbi:MAG: nucleoside deaminase [Bacteroidales bacterium]|nr:nucleoside deaminase [Bacteroidales bacterium]
MNQFMQIAIEEARKGITKGHGGPFGAVIVKNGEIIGRGHNMVLKQHDPTHHGEISAIRQAARKLRSYDLSNCELYTTGEPCHMCLCASMWANISKIYYGCTIADNGRIGFRDDKFDNIFGGREKLTHYLIQTDHDECLKLFDEYLETQHSLY